MAINITEPQPGRRGRLLWSVVGVALASAAYWGSAAETPQSSSGKDIFRFDTFGNETFWTDTLRLHEVDREAVDPTTALSVGLKVDADALPPGILKTADLKSPATTVALLKLNAVVGLKGTVVSKDGKDTLTRVGITCALCHSTVDDSVMPGIGHRLDGWPNRTLNPGAIIALSPALDDGQEGGLQLLGPGQVRPALQPGRQERAGGRFRPPSAWPASSRPPTPGDGDISYWNNYVAVTQMGGHGAFKEPRLGIAVEAEGRGPGEAEAARAREVPAQPGQARSARRAASTPRRPARRRRSSPGPAGARPATRARPSRDEKLHAPAETGMEPAYAARSATKKYRATPLRGLWQHAPYFHDGKAASLAAVVDHYDARSS